MNCLLICRGRVSSMKSALILPKMTETYSFFKFLEVAAGLLCCLSLNGHEEKIVERVSHLDCPAIMAMSIVAPENQLCILERKSIELISESRQGSTVVGKLCLLSLKC